MKSVYIHTAGGKTRGIMPDAWVFNIELKPEQCCIEALKNMYCIQAPAGKSGYKYVELFKQYTTGAYVKWIKGEYKASAVEPGLFVSDTNRTIYTDLQSALKKYILFNREYKSRLLTKSMPIFSVAHNIYRRCAMHDGHTYRENLRRQMARFIYPLEILTEGDTNRSEDKAVENIKRVFENK